MQFSSQHGGNYQTLGQVYKSTLKGKSKAMEYEEYKKRGDGGAVAITVKMDGEFGVMALDKGESEAKVFSPGKRATIRWDFEATREFTNTLKKKGHYSAVVYGEIYGVWTDDLKRRYSQPDAKVGSPLPFNIVSSLIQEKYGKPSDFEIRFGIFDIHSLDGKEIDEHDYWKRYELIHHLFQGNKYVHPVVAKRVGGVKLFEKYINSVGFEGLVIRTSTKILKVKNVFTFDAVIYGIEKKGKRMQLPTPRFGSVCVGLLLPNGDMIDMGTVGNGWDDEERIALHQELMKTKIGENDKIIYVKAKHIIEVAYTETQTVKSVSNFGPINKDGSFDWHSMNTAKGCGVRFPKRIPYVHPTTQIRGDYPMISDFPKTVTAPDLSVGQLPVLADIYSKELSGIVLKTHRGILSPGAEAELASPAIETNETEEDIKNDTDVLKDMPIIREDLPLLNFIPDTGINMRELMLASKMPMQDIQKQAEKLESVGLIEFKDGQYYKRVDLSVVGSQSVEDLPTYAALRIEDVGKQEAESAQKRRVSYWEKVLPYMLEETMGYPLGIVNFSKNSGMMPLVRNLKGKPIVISKKSEIEEFMTRTGKFEKAGTKAFSKGLITLFFIPSITGTDLVFITIDFDIEDLPEEDVRPYVYNAAVGLSDMFDVQPFFTGSSWHIAMRADDCSAIGDYGGINEPTGIVNELIAPVAKQVGLPLRGAAAHIPGQITIDYAVNKMNGPLRFPLSLHKKGLVMIPVDIDKIKSFDKVEAYPDNVLKNLNKYTKKVSAFYECLQEKKVKSKHTKKFASPSIDTAGFDEIKQMLSQIQDEDLKKQIVEEWERTH